MTASLRVLIIEDCPADVDLLLGELRQAGYEPEPEIVTTVTGLQSALARGPWDVVIAEHQVPGLSSVTALELVKKTAAEIPFIIVSGSISEEAAATALRAGARDYLGKDKLARLGPVVARELRDAAQRRERLSTERALRDAEEVFRALSAASPLGIFMSDAGGRHRYVNPNYRTLHVSTLMDCVGMGWLQTLVPEDRESTAVKWTNFVNAGGTGEFGPEYRVAPPAGPLRWLQMRAFPMHGESGELTGFIGTVEDITHRKHSEQSLRDSEQRFRDIFECSPDAIFVESESGVILDVNPAACALHGLAREQLIGKNVVDLVPEEARADLVRDFPRWFTGELRFFEGLATAADGRVVPVEMRGTRILYQGLPAVLLHVRDVAVRRQLEERLQQSAKIEAIGRLAGGVAHDFNNILTAITGYSELTLRQIEPKHPVRRHIEQVSRAANRAAALTAQLLAFSRRQTLQPKVLDLNVVVDEVQKMLRRLIGETIQLVTQLAPGLRAIKADPTQLEQVIMNLAVNARDAMPDGGQLLIETANVNVDSTLSRRGGEITPGPYVLLTVTDSGAGMTEEVRSHIFEPFFTTKPAGEGTGLGLATCYGIVAQSGGYIHVDSQPGQGTTFRIYLPSVDAPITRPDDAIAPVPGGTETILLVEDDTAVREVAITTLRNFGYRVLAAADGVGALELAGQAAAKKVVLVVTDVVMPQMSGKELADRLATVLPGVPVLFTSGYTQDEISHHGVLEEGINYLPKPYTPSSLARKVRDLLDGTAGAPVKRP